MVFHKSIVSSLLPLTNLSFFRTVKQRTLPAWLVRNLIEVQCQGYPMLKKFALYDANNLICVDFFHIGDFLNQKISKIVQMISSFQE